MTERPKQHWRFELGKFPQQCKIFLNDEQWWNVISLKIEAGMNAEGRPTATKLTLEVFPDDVLVEIDPSLHGELPDELFGARNVRRDADRTTGA